MIPEPGWIQAIWDAARIDGTPAGARVIDGEGRLIHAGAHEGCPVAGGEWATSPLFASDRLDAELLAPFVAPLGAWRGSEAIRGRIVGKAIALSLADSAVPEVLHGLRSSHPRSVLFFGGAAPGRVHPDLGDALWKTFRRLLDRGITPVYQWTGHSAPLIHEEASWRAAGVVVFASPSPMANPMLMRPDPIRPQPLDLVQAFVPECVVYLSADALGTDFRAASGDASRATVVFAAHHPIHEIEGRVDAHCGPGELPDLIDDFVAHRAPQAPVQVAHIEPVETTPGLTSVIIPVFNRWELTKACLESLKRHTVLPFEIIVVDNGSTDKTPRRLGHTSARVITNQENLGFPKAVNQGLAASRGEFVCILNNDTQVTTGWLEALLTALDIPGTGLVGPRTNEIGGLQKVPDAPGPDRGVAAHAWARRWVEERTGRTWITDRLVGFCLMARRRTIERVGAFDEGFGMGNFEDDELGRRVMAAGMTLRVADDAFVLHHGSATFKAMAIDYQAALHRGPAISEIGRTPAPPRRPHSFSATATPSELPPRPPLR